MNKQELYARRLTPSGKTCRRCSHQVVPVNQCTCGVNAVLLEEYPKYVEELAALAQRFMDDPPDGPAMRYWQKEFSALVPPHSEGTNRGLNVSLNMYETVRQERDANALCIEELRAALREYQEIASVIIECEARNPMIEWFNLSERFEETYNKASALVPSNSGGES